MDISSPVIRNTQEKAASLIEFSKTLNTKWQKMIITEAPNYKTLVKLCLERINNIIMEDNLSHKPRVYAALAAGFACIGHHITSKSLGECADISVEQLKPLLITDKDIQLDFLKGSRSIVDRLLDFDVMLNGLASRMSLVEALRAPDEADALYRKYGIKLMKGNKLKIRYTDYKLDNLLSNQRIVVNPIHDSQSLFREAVAQGLSGIKSYPDKCPILQRAARFYIIDLPEAEEDDGVISLSDTGS